MSFWWSPKSSSPKNKVVENSSSFSSFERLTKDAWEVAEDSIDNIPSSAQTSCIYVHENLNNKSCNGDTSSYIDDSNMNINILSDKTLHNKHLLISTSNNCMNINEDENQKLTNFTNKHDDKKSTHLDNLNFNQINCTDDHQQLQLPISDVHRLADEIVQHHRLSLGTLSTDKQNYLNSNSTTEQNLYNKQFSQNTIKENSESMTSNNGTRNSNLSKTKNQATRSNSLGSGKILGPGIGVRKKDIYSNNWTKCAEEEKSKILKFSSLLASTDLDIDCLRKIGWSGIPMQSRVDIWKILCGYLPLNPERREVVIKKKKVPTATLR